MSTKFLTTDELQKLLPTIRDAWRKDNKNVFVAMVMKDAMRKGQLVEVVIASAGVIVLEWLAVYLEEHHKATASLEACFEVMISLENESVKLAGVLP
jgi:hypothetical protein